MKDYLQASLAFVLVCTGIYFLAESLFWYADQKELLLQNQLKELTLHIGVTEPCVAEVHYSIFSDLNELQVYRWVLACEEANYLTSTPK